VPKSGGRRRKKGGGGKREKMRTYVQPASGANQSPTNCCLPAMAVTQIMARPLFPIFFGFKKTFLGVVWMGLTFGEIFYSSWSLEISLFFKLFFSSN
jgi:hypothetical protein